MAASSAQLPPGAYLKDISAWYNQNTIPRELRAPQSLPPEHWAKVVVEEGELHLFLDAGKTAVAVTAAAPAVIAPETPFRLESTGHSLRFCLHYFHEALVTDPKDLAGQMGRGRAA